MMISDADFDELFFDDGTPDPSKQEAPGAGRPLSNRKAGQLRHDPLQDTTTLAMMSPFGAALAMMSAFGAKART